MYSATVTVHLLVLVQVSVQQSGVIRIAHSSSLLSSSACRFLSLIEREWLQAGHPFRERCSHGPFRTQLLASTGGAMSALGRLKQAAFSFASATDPSGGSGLGLGFGGGGGGGGVSFSSANPDALSTPAASAGNTSAQLLAFQQQTLASRPARGLVAPTFVLFLDAVFELIPN